MERELEMGYHRITASCSEGGLALPVWLRPGLGTSLSAGGLSPPYLAAARSGERFALGEIP